MANTSQEVIIMEIKLESFEDKVLKFWVYGEDHTLLNALRSKLLEMPEVEYAYYRFDHPLKRNPLFVVRVKEGDPREAVKKAIEALLKEAEDFRKQVNEVYSKEKK